MVVLRVDVRREDLAVVVFLVALVLVVVVFKVGFVVVVAEVFLVVVVSLVGTVVDSVAVVVVVSATSLLVIVSVSVGVGVFSVVSAVVEVLISLIRGWLRCLLPNFAVDDMNRLFFPMWNSYYLSSNK